MPPRTRTRATKILKENIEVVKKSKVNASGKVSKNPRKPLGDKTNSLSDDNESVDIPIKQTKTTTKISKIESINAGDGVKPRRERRLPTRFVGNEVLVNLSKTKYVEISNSDMSNKNASKSSSVEGIIGKSTSKNVVKERPKRNCRLQSVKEKPNSESKTPNKSKKTASPFTTPTVNLDSSLLANRPKRICRLPSKFDDHSISPNKFIPVQPCHASTPKQQKKQENKEKQISKETPPKAVTQSKPNTKSNNKKSPDTNNNAKSKTVKKPNISTKLTTKQISLAANKKSPIKRFITTNSRKSPVKKSPIISHTSNKASPKISPTKRLINTSFSFRILEDKPKDDNLDVYEFTYDPKEEPAPQKKKRKRVVKKKPYKPKTVVFKNNYDLNVSKALETLKSKVKPGTKTIENVNENDVTEKRNAIASEKVNNSVTKPAQNTPQITDPVEIIDVSYAPPLTPANDSAKTSIHESNYASIRIEDIAADLELASDNNIDFNYSPVNSPLHPKTPENQPSITINTDPLNLQQASNIEVQDKTANAILNKDPLNLQEAPNIEVQNKTANTILNKDPLNLQEDLSFFDEVPVASSSMNVSVRHPHASPWRVEFGSLPIKWHPNTYVKPNMTPAVESSFIASENQNKKRHVYTNLVPQTNESLPPIVEDNAPNLIQTSIISFIKEVAERNANKNKRGRSATPTKANSLFEDCTDTEFGYKTPKKARKDKAVVTPNTSNTSSHKSVEKDTSKESNQSEKTTNKKKDKDCTYFGFDDTSEIDNENLPPGKIKKQNERVRALRPRARAVLQEINNQGPTRSILPANKKLASSEVVDQIYEQLKSAEDAPQFPDKETANQGVTDNVVVTNIGDVTNDDDESVHLFEDIELIHHLKPQRKSYGKVKKVTFRQNSISDSDDTQDEEPARVTDDEYDDLADLTFQVPNVTKKKSKKKTKKQLTKKEEREVEEWAAGFNSMCEDIDDFPLIVE